MIALYLISHWCAKAGVSQEKREDQYLKTCGGAKLPIPACWD